MPSGIIASVAFIASHAHHTTHPSQRTWGKMAASPNRANKKPGDGTRPIPDEAVWTMLQDAYREVKKDTDPDDVELYQAFDAKDDGFKVPFEVRQSPGKGRGIFCTELVRKGRIVHEARCGRFYTEQQWREFLTSIPHEWAKDCVDWAYVEEGDEGKVSVWLDFCDAALMNHGVHLSRWEKLCGCVSRRSRYSANKYGGSDEANVKNILHEGKWCYDAIRDIQAGEEILCDYTAFHDYDEPLSWFEDTWDEYWSDSSSSSSSSSSTDE